MTEEARRSIEEHLGDYRAKMETAGRARKHNNRTIADVRPIADFHGLRHTCGAWLAQAGAHPKVVQTIMRHSSITLTMDRYGHLFPGEASEAVARPIL